MPDPAHDEDAVRRLLAEARHDEPLPPEVAERLDTLLGRLVEVRSAETGVTSLGARRQRRKGLLLLAAAAAVVAGIVVPTVNQLGSRSGSNSATSADSAAQAPSSSSSSTSREEQAAGGSADDSAASLAAPQAAVLALTSAGFDAEVRAALTAVAQGRSQLAAPSGSSVPAGGCQPPADAYATVPVTYDGSPGNLVLAPPEDGRQQADLVLCGDVAAARRVDVPLS